MSKKAQKNGRNHKKTGKKRAILPKRPFKTGMPVLKRATSSHWTTAVTEEATTAVTKEESVADVTAEDSTTADNN